MGRRAVGSSSTTEMDTKVSSTTRQRRRLEFLAPFRLSMTWNTLVPPSELKELRDIEEEEEVLRCGFPRS